LLFNKLFPIVDTCLSSEDIARQSCAMAPKWRFLRPVFPASRMQHISDWVSSFLTAHQHITGYSGPQMVDSKRRSTFQTCILNSH